MTNPATLFRTSRRNGPGLQLPGKARGVTRALAAACERSTRRSAA